MYFKLPLSLKKTANVLLKAGFQCYLVGGAVRDLLLARTVKDYDLATDANPPVLLNLFRRVIPTGAKHGTVTVLESDNQYEITTFRVEGPYTDFRRPSEVNWSNKIDEDLKRRDFTINAIAWDFKAKSIYDPFNGQRDLKAKIIRALGLPTERFQEDALRILRAIRLACELNFKIEDETFKALVANSSLILNISIERIREELEKILNCPLPSMGFRLMDEVGVLKLILPELVNCKNIEQGLLHKFDVYEHSLLTLDAAKAANLTVKLAALFHDLGKACTQSLNKRGELCFYHHEKHSAEIAERILTRLRFPNRIIKDVIHLISLHMFHYELSWTDAAIRRFLKRTGLEYLADLFALRKADQYALQGFFLDDKLLAELQNRIQQVLKAEPVLKLKDLAIDGSALIETLKISPGPLIGTILNFLLEAVLDDPQLNNKEKLLQLAENFFKERLYSGKLKG